MVETSRGAAALPLVVREIPGTDRSDAISPYGYPGARLSGDSEIDVAPAELASSGLVSVFVRERLDRAALAAAEPRSTVWLHDPALPRRLRPRLASQIRASRRAGWNCEVESGPAVPGEERTAFGALYRETMARTGASGRYFFDDAYLGAALDFERSWLLLARSGPGEPAGAGAIAAVSDGMLHYFLGGTAEGAIAESPFRVVVDAMCELAGEVGLPLNLGGGVSPGDGLEAFKRGFANASTEFRTAGLVGDRRAYDELSAGRDAPAGFFPAYRAPL
ncbi:GNAT family N-acetyltransferase [Thermoleophilia bacterium SCSIO 60948]|nr:GNAT family N-acetyltransferase [Thermoleophilia bacterium SCSIO 60948]